ncbi:unnamed protein product [Allacma fusca]|uniref:Uncharacterized protein n=1 Tax=Allacma fusca TaxID=39272 RepID=A0A8J2L5P8_9HEXA|nr:unnamed protein product [Allacma fusca]
MEMEPEENFVQENKVTWQAETEDADNDNGSDSDPEDRQTAALKAVKKSILKRKKRAARIRNALCKKSNILKIKLWQNLLPAFRKQRTPTPSPPLPARSPSPSPSPPPSISHRFSPDITQYRRKPLLLAPKPRIESPTKSTSSSSDNESGNDNEVEKKGDENEDSVSLKSMVSFDGSEGQSVDVDDDASILLCNKGQPVVKLDASFVKDFLQSGKPIRAAALAALEAVHGKKISEAEALQRLRKAYIVKPTLPKGRGRRSIYKKNSKPTRAPKLSNWCSVVNSITYRNAYFQVGDIVFVLGEDHQIYFLQIQSLMMDRKEYEAYASMFWLTPKPEFNGPRFPFHPKNYNLRRDIPLYDDALDNVTHVLHCPLDYFDGHPSYWQPVPGTVYQQLGEPLVKWVQLDKPKKQETSNEMEVPKSEDENDSVVVKTEKAEGENDLEDEKFDVSDLVPEVKIEPPDSSGESEGESSNAGSHLSFPEFDVHILETSSPTMEIEVETS